MTPMTDASARQADRYHRQVLLPGIGPEGQRRLRTSHALVVGCGALGSVIIDALARAGIGTLTLVDRDVVELTNLQRQVLYDEQDAAEGIPKAEAARRRVARVNREVTVHARVEDFGFRNAERLLTGADLILDGLDNFETRYLLNDLAVRHGLPYLYGGAVGTTGMAMTILPHPAHRTDRVERRVHWSAAEATGCLRCLFPAPPPPGSSPTCDTAGVLGPVVSIIASRQASEAIKLLTGAVGAVDRHLLSVDLWRNDLRRFDVGGARDPDRCPCCGAGRFEHLAGDAAGSAIALCGRDAIQVTPAGAGPGSVDLPAAAERLAPHGAFTAGAFLLRGEFREERADDGQAVGLTLFADGRALFRGAGTPDRARTLYARYVGG